MCPCHVYPVMFYFSSSSEAYVQILLCVLKPQPVCLNSMEMTHDFLSLYHSCALYGISLTMMFANATSFLCDLCLLTCSTGTEDYRSKLSGDCFADLACPEKCRCEGTTVDCSNQKLTKIPDHIPQYTAEL